jgi:hypothetical protein
VTGLHKSAPRTYDDSCGRGTQQAQLRETVAMSRNWEATGAEVGPDTLAHEERLWVLEWQTHDGKLDSRRKLSVD